jgi:hypothetical protein
MSRKLKVSFIIVIFLLIGGSANAGAGPKSAGTPSPSGPARPAGAANAAPLSQTGSGFTYQGRLKNGGNPANGQYDLQFTLYDTPTGGTQVGTPITITNQTVADGLFTVTLDFGGVFQGDARWLDIAVRSTGGGSFSPLSPRQALTASPYALGLVPGAVVNGATGPGGILFQVNNSGGNSMAGFTGSASDSAIYGVNTHITSTLGVGVKGQGYHYATGVEGASVYGKGVYGHSSVGPGVFGTTLNGAPGVEGASAYGDGVYGHSDSGPGVFGTSQYGVGGYFTSTNSYGVLATSTAGSGGYFTSTSGIGVYGVSNTNTGVQGVSTGSWGGYFTSGTGTGLEGYSTSGNGVYGFTSGSGRTGVLGFSSAITSALGVIGEADTGANAIGVDGYSTAGYGVQGYGGVTGVQGNSSSGYGVSGQSTTTYGVRGTSDSAAGVGGSSTSNDGVFGVTNAGGHSGVTGIYGGSTSGNGVYGQSSVGYAGWFNGNVRITGSCCSASMGTYQIDDPLDPTNKYLNQAAVESPDMLDVLSGNATTDAQGNATITLPVYFQATNRDFRYQLTAIGQFAQAIVSSEIKVNDFSIKTDKPNVKVSWQVTGVRSDPYAQAHPLTAEQAKPAGEQGYYLHPDLYGQPNSKSVDPYVRNPRPIGDPVPIPARPGGDPVPAIPGGK